MTQMKGQTVADQREQSGDDDSLSPMEYVRANGFIDFPHAWMIACRTAPEHHHNECSFNMTGGAILCDCEVLTESSEYVLAYTGGSGGRP